MDPFGLTTDVNPVLAFRDAVQYTWHLPRLDLAQVGLDRRDPRP
jgi:hypothetical protein